MVLSLLLVTGPADIWLIWVVTFLYGAVGYLTGGAQSGLVRDMLDDDELAGGNALLSTIDQALRLVSPLLGTASYAVAGPRAVVVLTAVVFAVGALLIVRIDAVESTRERSDNSYLTELTAGFRDLRRIPPVGTLTVAMAITIGATGFSNVVAFPLMEHGLGVAPEMLGALVSLQGIGAVVGGLTAARLVARLGEARTIALGMLTLAVGLAPPARNAADAGAADGALHDGEPRGGEGTGRDGRGVVDASRTA